jgi:hypothetical protein
MYTMAEPSDDKNSEHDPPKNRQPSAIDPSGIASDDSRELGGARTGPAAGSGHEVSVALQGAGSKFAPIVNPPKIPNPPVMAFANNSFEAAADTVTGRWPNLVLNQSSVAGPPFPLASEARASTTAISKEISDVFEAMQERVRVLEIEVSRMPPPPAGLGHNNPPEPIEAVPFSAAEWAEMRGLLSVLKEQVIVPTREPQEAKAAASTLKLIGEKLLSFIGRHGEEYSSELSKKLGGNTADLLKYWVLTYYGYSTLKALGADLIGLHDHVQAWLRLLGY